MPWTSTRTDRKLLLCGHWRVDTWDFSEHLSPQRIVERPGGALSGRWNPQGSTYATVVLDRLRLWSAPQPEWKIVGETPCRTLHATAAGTHVLGAHDDGRLRLWDCSQWTVKQEMDIGRVPIAVSLHPDGHTVAAGFSDHPAVEIYDLLNSSRLARLTMHRSPVKSLDFSADGQQLVTASRAGKVRVFGARDYSLVHEFEHGNEVLSTQFSPDARRILTTVRYDGIHLWNLEQGQVEHAIPTRATAWRATFDSQGSRIAAGTWTPEVVVFDTANGQELKTLIGNTQLPTHTVFSHDDRLVAAGSASGILRLWDAEYGKVSVEMDGPPGSLSRIAFVNDDREIASSGKGQEGLLVWNLQHYAQHIRQNADYWIETLRREQLEGVDWDAVNDWRLSLTPPK